MAGTPSENNRCYYKLFQYSVKSLKLFIFFCKFSLRYFSRYYLFFYLWEIPSVGGNIQTGRGGVHGKNLLVTTSYQYALRLVSSCAPVLECRVMTRYTRARVVVSHDFVKIKNFKFRIMPITIIYEKTII